jgi:putative tryptophan/tyrosine transport system substrate-binding protein
MRRREFIAALGGAAAWPLGARAQQPAMSVVAFVSSVSASTNPHLVDAFRQGLSEAGYDEGRNVAIEYRWADGQYDRLPAIMAEVMNRQAAVIFAASLPVAVAAKASTATIPIVFVMGADPVKMGLAASLGRPGGNVTGVFQYYGALGGKRLELLRELAPAAGTVAVLSNPSNPNAEAHLNDITAAARAMGQAIKVFRASTEGEVAAAFDGLIHEGAGALLVADDPFFNNARPQLITLAARHRLPAIYYAREFVVNGGLISYGSSSGDNYRQGGIYVGRILKGAQPADLPILQPTKFELAINLKTADALGLTIPTTLLARADEVIE